jgi:hypothetical protein
LTMQDRNAALIAAFLLVCVPFMLAALYPEYRHFSFVWLIGPVVFALLGVVVLRCPHCGKYAGRTPRGLHTPFVGTECRYCGKGY